MLRNKNQIKKLLLVGIWGWGIFLRLYRLPQTLMFQGDQGRDAIVVKQILKNADFTLLGPVTSMGNLYLGPFYYYFMVPFLAVTYPNPIGPAIGVALVNILTMILLYVFTRRMIHTPAALIATCLYAFWAVAVEYSRFSWNPNIAPLFSLLIVYSLYQVHRTGSVKWLWGVFVFAGLLFQLHYVALLMAPIIALSLAWTMWRRRDRKFTLMVLIATTISVGIISLPLTIFDITHERVISRSVVRFFGGEEEFILPVTKALAIFKASEGRAFLVLSQLLLSFKHVVIDRVITYAFVTLALIFGYRARNSKYRYGVFLVFLTLFVGIVGLGVLPSSVFDHYLLYLTPIIVMGYGFLGGVLWRAHGVGKIVVIVCLSAFIARQATRMPTFKAATPRSVAYYQRVAEVIYPLTHKTGAYNVAAIAENRDFLGMSYRYFLEVTDNPPAHYDEIFNLQQLIIIDEMNTTSPLSQASAGIAHPATYLHGMVNTVHVPNGPTIYVVE